MALRWSYKKREDFAESKQRTCINCGKTGLISKRDANGDYSTVYNIDHIIPQVSGGADDVDNLQLLCQPCNTSKNAMSNDDFPSHYDYKAEVERMKIELSEVTGLDDRYIKRMIHSFSIKDQYHVLSKLL